MRTPRVPAATSSASDAAPLARDRPAERTEKQDLDAHEDEHLGRAEHTIVGLGHAWLRLQRLWLRHLWRLRLLLLRTPRHRTGRRDRTKRGASGRASAFSGRGRVLRQGRAGHCQQGKRERRRREQLACGATGDSGMERVCRQGSISSSPARPDKDRSSHWEFIFVNSLSGVSAVTA